MIATLTGKPMAKRVDVAVKMDAEVIRKAKIVAAYREQTLAEFLSSTLGEIVDDLMRQEQEIENARKRSDAKRPKEGK